MRSDIFSHTSRRARRVNQVDVKPGALIDGALDLVKSHPLPLLGPPVLLGIVAAAVSPSPRSVGATTALLSLLVFAGLLIAFALVTLVTVRFALDALATGREPDLPSAWHGVQHKLWPSVGVVLAWGFALGVGFLLLVVPGIVLAAALFPLVPVVLSESPGFEASFRRAWAITQGDRWDLALVVLLGVVGAIVAAVLGFIPLIGNLLAGVANGTVGGAMAAAVAVYYARRTRSATGAPPS